MGIQVNDISKRFNNDFVALHNVSLDIKSGELIALLGPSGSGKTTLLRIIAGLEFADSGTVILDGQELRTKNAKERNVGFVFQHYALFKHMTVFQNVAFGLSVRPKAQRPSDQEIRRKVMDLLELIHLEAYHDRYPSQLSGGQRQRVALARALAVEPKVLLLDEPFGALDAKVRKELRRWMRRLHDDIHITSIFVTHDQEEAMEVADRVVVMSNGCIEQVGTPEQVYHHPVNGFVYDFLGNYNEFDGWKDKDGAVHLAETEIVEIPEETIVQASTQTGWLGRYPEISHVVNKVVPGLLPEKIAPVIVKKKKTIRRPPDATAVKLFTRPHEIFVSKVLDGDEYVTARVTHINPASALVKLELERPGGAILQAEIPKTVVDELNIKRGDMLYIRPKATRVFE
ncbi:MAG: sulfate/thiosulfate transport system ATP-binding protein [Alphaproteobacteria bacterium]|nr:sulfate/thiosulfate transport system ATP-binding protein [Alphaproteobacteria bacterium]